MSTMTLDRATDHRVDRARSLPNDTVVARHVCASTPASAQRIALSIVAPTPNTNATQMWLGDVHDKGFDSDDATKRNIPGRLDGMT